MDRDIRNTEVFQEAERIFKAASMPSAGIVSGMADLQLSVDQSRLLFTGTLFDSLNGSTVTRICEIDLGTALVQVISSGPNSDNNARISPDRKTIAFLSDRHRASDFQLFFIDAGTHAVTAGPRVEGWVEYLQWSPNGRRILLGVAGHGAELSSGQGAYKTDELHGDQPSWMPEVIGLSSDSMRRRAWIVDVDTLALSPASAEHENAWEASWCGDERLAIIASPDPEEGAWYRSRLSVIDVPTGASTGLYQPTYQIALPRSSPSGRQVAFIEAVASDRGYLAGNLLICELDGGTCRVLTTVEVDTSYFEWRSESLILAAGHRGLETVVLLLDIEAGSIKALWESTSDTTSGKYAAVLGLEDSEDFAFIGESFFERPHLVTMTGGTLTGLAPSVGDREGRDYCGEVEPVRWQAPDGLLLEGWLLRPRRKPPYPTILAIHGGPVLHWRPYWIGQDATTVMLLRRGFAVFLPNPRGSSGRGQAFAARILGDVGGADTSDFLSGIDHLVGTGIADPTRLGVTGLSYGGLMTCWLTTQDERFRAAIAVGPATNHVSHHLLCNIPQFVQLFLDDHYTNLAGNYYSRSPVLHAHKSRTPTLLVGGALDRCTPPEESIQFQRALTENNVESSLVIYPEEGHGVQGLPAAIDFSARCVMWFERYLRVA